MRIWWRLAPLRLTVMKDFRKSLKLLKVPFNKVHSLARSVHLIQFGRVITQADTVECPPRTQAAFNPLKDFLAMEYIRRLKCTLEKGQQKKQHSTLVKDFWQTMDQTLNHLVNNGNSRKDPKVMRI